MANKIKYGDRELDMGDLTLEQAKQLMARHFPELADPQVDKKENKNDTIYTFTKKAGKKGQHEVGAAVENDQGPADRAETSESDR